MTTRRKLPRFAAVLACAATIVLSACTSSGGDDGKYQFDGATTIGSVIKAKDRLPAPELSGTRLDGSGKLAVSQYKNKVVVLAFWGSWCPPCRVEMPQLQGLHANLADKGVAFVGVDSRDDPDNAKAFLKNNAITFPSVVDETGNIAQRLGNVPANLPFTIVIDRSGRVAAAYIARYGSKDLSRALTTLRGET